MGLKFAGRTPSRGSRFLRGAPRAHVPRATAISPDTIYFSVALGIGVLCLLVALARAVLGAPGSSFAAVIFSLPLILTRIAHQSAPQNALWFAGGVLAVCALWFGLSKFFHRRAPDAFFLALLAFQFFFVARYAASLLPPAGPLSIFALSAPQKINALLQIVLIVVVAAWSTRALPKTSYENSAPSRVTGFLKKRRMPLRIMGVLLAIAAIVVTYLLSPLFFQEANTFLALGTPLIFALWIVLDSFYLVGRALWQRVH